MQESRRATRDEGGREGEKGSTTARNEGARKEGARKQGGRDVGKKARGGREDQ